MSLCNYYVIELLNNQTNTIYTEKKPKTSNIFVIYLIYIKYFCLFSLVVHLRKNQIDKEVFLTCVYKGKFYAFGPINFWQNELMKKKIRIRKRILTD